MVTSYLSLILARSRSRKILGEGHPRSLFNIVNVKNDCSIRLYLRGGAHAPNITHAGSAPAFLQHYIL